MSSSPAASGPRRIVAIVNAGSGSGSDPALAERLTALFRAAGADADVRLAKSADIDAAVQAAVAERPDVIAAGGGDGTVSAVAAALLGSDVAGDIALAVLPLGTLNHFAKDLGMPLDLEAAVAAIATGPIGRVDAGEVNGRVFVNNSSLGLYPDIVRDRERQQKRLGRGKWPSMLWATMAALRRYPFLSVRLKTGDGDHVYRTPFVFIGNNEYRMDGFAIGERDGLADGHLSLYIAERPGRMRLLQLAIRALFGRLRQARDFRVFHATEIVIESRHRRLRVATDGEVTVLKPPLRYAVRAGSLPVVQPPVAPAPPT